MALVVRRHRNRFCSNEILHQSLSSSSSASCSCSSSSSLFYFYFLFFYFFKLHVTATDASFAVSTSVLCEIRLTHGVQQRDQPTFSGVVCQVGDVLK